LYPDAQPQVFGEIHEPPFRYDAEQTVENISTQSNTDSTNIRRCLPLLQMDPFHPVLHEHTLGFEQLPLTHDGEQIAKREKISA
jgi:hypothetical protein